MNYSINIFLACVLPFLTLASTVEIYFAPEQRQQAQWVSSILVKKGIPMDFINQQVNYRPCQRHYDDKNQLLVLCIDENNELKILKFDRQEFFWQMKPLLEI